MRQLGVTTVKSSPDLTMVVHLVSPDERYDIVYLRNYAVLQVKDVLARLPGVGQVQVFGAATTPCGSGSIPQKVAARGLSAGDVVRAIREQNVQVAAGVVGAPADAGEGGLPAQRERARPAGRRGGVRRHHRQDRRATASSPGSATWRASSWAPASYALRSLLEQQGRRRRSRSSRRPGSNALAALDRGARDHGGAQGRTSRRAWTTGSSTTRPIIVRDGIHEVVNTLLEAVLLVVIVVVLFLQTWRASIIPLVAVPVSIVGTFASCWRFGFSINTLSLFGLVLAIGIVVDDAIVVVENVERNIEDGLSPREATLQGDGGGERPDHRDRAGALRGVRPDRLHQRAHRPVLPPVRADHRVLDGDLGVQLADPVAGAERDPAPAPRRRRPTG